MLGGTKGSIINVKKLETRHKNGVLIINQSINTTRTILRLFKNSDSYSIDFFL